jgi:hypothetical protein
MEVIKLRTCKQCGKKWYPRKPGTPRRHVVGLVLAGTMAAATAAAQTAQTTLHDVHVAGKVMTVGTATGPDGKEHMLVGVRLASPLPGGATKVLAIVTHHEPSEAVRNGLAFHSGHVAVVDTVDLSCPVVLVRNSGAMGQDCTFNSYSGPLNP